MSGILAQHVAKGPRSGCIVPVGHLDDAPPKRASVTLPIRDDTMVTTCMESLSRGSSLYIPSSARGDIPHRSPPRLKGVTSIEEDTWGLHCISNVPSAEGSPKNTPRGDRDTPSLTEDSSLGNTLRSQGSYSSPEQQRTFAPRAPLMHPGQYNTMPPCMLMPTLPTLSNPYNSQPSSQQSQTQCQTAAFQTDVAHHSPPPTCSQSRSNVKLPPFHLTDKEQRLKDAIHRYVLENNPKGSVNLVHMQTHLRETCADVVKDGLQRFENSWQLWLSVCQTVQLFQYAEEDITRLLLDGWAEANDTRIRLSTSRKWEEYDGRAAKEFNESVGKAQLACVEAVLIRGAADIADLRDIVAERVPYFQKISKNALKRILLRIRDSPLWVTGTVWKPRRFL